MTISFIFQKSLDGLEEILSMQCNSISIVLFKLCELFCFNCRYPSRTIDFVTSNVKISLQPIDTDNEYYD